MARDVSKRLLLQLLYILLVMIETTLHVHKVVGEYAPLVKLSAPDRHGNRAMPVHLGLM